MASASEQKYEEMTSPSQIDSPEPHQNEDGDEIMSSASPDKSHEQELKEDDSDESGVSALSLDDNDPKSTTDDGLNGLEALGEMEKASSLHPDVCHNLTLSPSRHVTPSSQPDTPPHSHSSPSHPGPDQKYTKAPISQSYPSSPISARNTV